MMKTDCQDVLDFWFFPSGHPQYLRPRREWFAKDPAFDAEIARRWGPLVEQAGAGGLLEWENAPLGALARIILLDQFPRNIWRDTPKAFEMDPQALAASLRLLGRGADRGLAPMQRVFAYLPLEHAEDLATQERSVALFRELADQAPETAENLDYAVRHRDIVARFGRFPHRNRILGRATTPEETAFLAQPGSGF